jgi:hypothetical protein
MAGGYGALFMQELQETVMNATGAPALPLAPTTTHIILTHTTLTDAYLVTDTGRMAGANSTDFTAQIANTTATWSLPTATSPSVFDNKVVITISTGNFSAPSETTIKGWFMASTRSTAAGRVIAWGDVTPNQTVSTGNTVSFAISALTFTLGGGTAT